MSSRTEILLCPILSATPPCSRSESPPCCSCPACWPPSVVAAVPEADGGRWAATGRRWECCAGSSMAPGWPSWPPTTGSVARRPTAICTRASTSSPRRRPGCAGRCWPLALQGIRTSPWTARSSAPTGSAFPVRPPAATGRSAGWICGGRASTPPTAATCRSSPPRMAGRYGPGGDDVESLVQVAVAGRVADTGIAGKEVHVGAVAQPAQHQHHLGVHRGRPLPRPRTMPASMPGDPAGHGLEDGCGHVQAGTIGHDELLGKRSGFFGETNPDPRGSSSHLRFARRQRRCVRAEGRPRMLARKPHCVDADFGPLFLKFCSYFPYTARLCLNGHEWAKRQAAQAGIGFTA